MVIDVGDLTEDGREHPSSIQPVLERLWLPPGELQCPHFAWRPSSSSFLGRRASKASAETKTSSGIVTQRTIEQKIEEENNQRCFQNPGLSNKKQKHVLKHQPQTFLCYCMHIGSTLKVLPQFAGLFWK